MSTGRQALETFIARARRQADYARQPSAESPLFPARVYIEPTNACNLRCVHCHHTALKQGVFRRKTGLMDMALYRRVIDELAEQGSEISLNVQGEPTLHPELPAMVAYSRQRGLFTSLLTNATRLTEPLAQRLVTAGLNRVVFSFDSVVAEEYERIRPPAKFAPTLLNLLRFLRANEAAGHPVFVCTSVIPQQRNRASLAAYDTYFGALPVDTIFHSALLNLSGHSGIAEEAAGFPAGDGTPLCRVPWELLTVNWDGSVTVCGLDFNVLCPVGDAPRQTLAEIWNGAALQAFRRAHLDGTFPDGEPATALCRDCNSRFDPEYDFRRYAEFAERDIARKTQQHATDGGRPRPDAAKQERLTAEIARLEAACPAS